MRDINLRHLGSEEENFFFFPSSYCLIVLLKEHTIKASSLFLITILMGATVFENTECFG